MTKRYIFTAVAGRSGQESLTDLFRRHVPGCYAAFEEPHASPSLPGTLGRYEKKFRRRFVETNELLGRGKTLTAFENGDLDFLVRVAERRMKTINRTLNRLDASIYVDISKYFIRGLHEGFRRSVPQFSLIRLTRNPILNMRSFLNRNKLFTLDNSLPEIRSNLLQMDSEKMDKGELYLWAWCEVYLRAERLADQKEVSHFVDIRTDQLTDCAFMDSVLDALALTHSPVERAEPKNTNKSHKFGETIVSPADIQTFERFYDRIPLETKVRINYFADYDPYQCLPENNGSGVSIKQ